MRTTASDLYNDLFDLENRPSAGVRHWGRAVEIQLQRVRDAGRAAVEHQTHRGSSAGTAEDDDNVPPIATLLHLDVNYLVLAIRNVVRFHVALKKKVNDPRLNRAWEAFRLAVPEAIAFRDFYEHLDAYVLASEGRHNKTIIDRSSPTLLRATYDDSLVILFADRAFDVMAAGNAARELAGQTVSVWEEALDAAKAPYEQPPPDDGIERRLNVSFSVSEIVRDEHGAKHSVGVLRDVWIEETPEADG